MVTGGPETLWAGSVCCGYALEAQLFAETTYSTGRAYGTPDGFQPYLVRNDHFFEVAIIAALRR